MGSICNCVRAGAATATSIMYVAVVGTPVPINMHDIAINISEKNNVRSAKEK